MYLIPEEFKRCIDSQNLILLNEAGKRIYPPLHKININNTPAPTIGGVSDAFLHDDGMRFDEGTISYKSATTKISKRRRVFNFVTSFIFD